jgi:hypothetical protein
MKQILFAILFVILGVNVGFAQTPRYPKAKVDFDDFKGLVAKVEAHRATRLVDLNMFLKMSKDPGVIILDSSSAFRYERVHVKGAKHLAFTDFTHELDELVDVNDPRIVFEGSMVSKKLEPFTK